MRLFPSTPFIRIMRLLRLTSAVLPGMFPAAGHALSVLRTSCGGVACLLLMIALALQTSVPAFAKADNNARKPGKKVITTKTVATKSGVKAGTREIKPTRKSSPAKAVSSTQQEVSRKQGNLRELRGQLEALRKEVAHTEDKHASATDQLKSIEKEISSSERDLRTLSLQRSKLQATLKALNQQAHDLESQLSAQQSQLEQLVYRQYLQGHPDALQTLLNGNDLNQSMRDLYYLSAVGQARREMVADIETTLKRKRDVAETTQARANDLATVENRHKQQRDKLVVQHAQRKIVLGKMETQLAEQRRKIGNLERDEKQLSQLVDQLNRAIAAQEAAARREAARQAAAQREAARQQEEARRMQRSRRPAGTPPAEDNAPASTSETRVAQAPASMPTSNLTQMRGQMRLPVRGTVTNRFGAARPEGGTWKGVFIRAATGSDVKAIAGGRVVFADWMRGFGNLLIIDHGRGYLSIYGNNDALFKQTGDTLHSGDVIASAGSSGGNAESGLYFEIRHQGKPIDPLRWVSL